MKVLEFFKPERMRQTAPDPDPPPAPSPSPELSLNDLLLHPRWKFHPVDPARHVYDPQTIANAAAVFSAQQLHRIAEELTRIRQHLTRAPLTAFPSLREDDDASSD